MALKRPKYFDPKILHQTTLAESWSKASTKTPSKTHRCTDVEAGTNDNDSTDSPKFKTPKKTYSKNTRVTRSPLKAADIYTSSDEDDEVIKNSQNTRESKLRRNINKTTAKRSTRTPKKSTPQKANVPSTPGSTNKRLSISDVCDANSTVIKEELDEMQGDITDGEGIEMRHDLSGIIVDNRLHSSPLEYSPTITRHIANVELKSEQEESEGEVRDPLHAEEKANRDGASRVSERIKGRASEAQEASGRLTESEKCSTDATNQAKVLKSRSINTTNNGDSKAARKSKKDSESDDELTEDDLQKLFKLNVKLQHDVPPQHEIENNAGTHALSEDQIRQFESYGPLKKGPFKNNEDDIVRKNWKNFCKLHDWDEDVVQPFLYMRHKGIYYMPDLLQRKNFVRFLANGLPWRSLYSVYFRFRNLYNSSANNGKYSAKEDKIIMMHMREASKSKATNACAEVAKILNRKRHSIWQRFQKLKVNVEDGNSKDDSDENNSDFENVEKQKKKQKKNSLEKKKVSEHKQEDDSDENDPDFEDVEKEKKKKKKKNSSKKKFSGVKQEVSKVIYANVKWSSPLVKKFIEMLLEATVCEDLEELKNEVFDESTWDEMEERMSIDRLTLKNFWYHQLHMQLFCPTPLYLNDLKIEFIEYMHGKEEKLLEDMGWDTIASNFEGVTPLFLSKLFEHLAKCAAAKINSSELNDIVEYLFESHLPELKENTVDAILPKLHYKNGKFVVVDKGTEKKIPDMATSHPLSEDEEQRCEK